MGKVAGNYIPRWRGGDPISSKDTVGERNWGVWGQETGVNFRRRMREGKLRKSGELTPIRGWLGPVWARGGGLAGYLVVDQGGDGGGRHTCINSGNAQLYDQAPPETRRHPRPITVYQAALNSTFFKVPLTMIIYPR